MFISFVFQVKKGVFRAAQDRQANIAKIKQRRLSRNRSFNSSLSSFSNSFSSAAAVISGKDVGDRAHTKFNYQYRMLIINCLLFPYIIGKKKIVCLLWWLFSCVLTCCAFHSFNSIHIYSFSTLDSVIDSASAWPGFNPLAYDASVLHSQYQRHWINISSEILAYLWAPVLATNALEMSVDVIRMTYHSYKAKQNNNGAQPNQSHSNVMHYPVVATYYSIFITCYIALVTSNPFVFLLEIFMLLINMVRRCV